MSSDEFRYAAFISYRHEPVGRKWATWLHRTIERYRVPKSLQKVRGVPPRIGRVFRDEEELAASSDLSAEIDKALVQSKFLIVVCTPRTPHSQWVNEEVRRFRELGRGDRILALLVEGEPKESFPPALVEIRRQTVDRVAYNAESIETIEPLAADVRNTRAEKESHVTGQAALRIIAALVGVHYDELFRRDARARAARLGRLAAVASVIMLGALLLSIYAISQKRVAEQQRRLAEEQRVEADRQRADAVAVVEYLTGEIISSADPIVNRGEVITVRQLIARTAAQVNERFADHPAARGAIHYRLARMFDNLGETARSLDHARQASAAFQSSSGDDEEMQIFALNAEAMALQGLGKFDEGLKLHQEVFRRSLAYRGPDWPFTLNSQKNNSYILARLNRFAEAEPLGRAALKGYRRALGTHHSGTPQALTVYAVVVSGLGRQEDALELYRYALFLGRQINGDDHIGTMMIESNVTNMLIDLSRFDEAALMLPDLIARLERVLGPDHRLLAMPYRNFAETELYAGDATAALASAERAMRICRQNLEETRDRTIRFCAATCAKCLGASGRRTEAAAIIAEFGPAPIRAKSVSFPDEKSMLDFVSELRAEFARIAATQPSARPSKDVAITTRPRRD